MHRQKSYVEIIRRRQAAQKESHHDSVRELVSKSPTSLQNLKRRSAGKAGRGLRSAPAALMFLISGFHPYLQPGDTGCGASSGRTAFVVIFLALPKHEVVTCKDLPTGIAFIGCHPWLVQFCHFSAIAERSPDPSSPLFIPFPQLIPSTASCIGLPPDLLRQKYP